MPRVAGLVSIWRKIITGEGKSWVLFAHGTCVVLSEPGADPAGHAVAVLAEFGPVIPGSPAGDFATIDVPAAPGWVVTGHHPDVLTYVAPEAVFSADDVLVGLAGRAKRDRDGRELAVVHVEDSRS